MNEPITISSGYRSPQLNSHPSVKGVANFQHLKGEAADIRIPWIQSADGKLIQVVEKGRKYAEYILDHCLFDQMLFETDSHGIKWLHVSCKRTGNRQTYKPNFKA